MHELPLDGRLRQILRHDRFLEDTVLLWIFQRLDDRLGGQSVLEGVAPGLLFSIFGPRARAPERVAAVCLELPKRGHEASDLAVDSSDAGAFEAAGATPLPSTLPLPMEGTVSVAVFGPGRRVLFHGVSAILTESSPRRLHHARSSRERWSSR